MRNLKSAPSRAAVAALSLGLAVSPAPARDEPPVFGTDVSLVLVPVFAVDSKGQAVRGLRSEDFRVEEDGKPVEVVSFRYVDTSELDEVEDLRRSPAARRRFLLLFDLSFTSVGGLNRARRAAASFVRTSLADSDLVAVATFDAHRGLRLVANFTDDRALLAHAVDGLGVPSVSKISDPLALAADLQITDIAAAGPGSATEVPQVLLDSAAAVVVRQMRAADREQYRSHIERAAAAFQDLARGLRNVAGRKQVVYFSAGFDSRLFVGEDGYERQSSSNAVVEGRLWDVDSQSRYGDSRIRNLFAEAAESLARSDAVVHALDVTGFGEDTSISRATPLVSPGAGATMAVRESVSGRESLNFISAETGGRFFKDANDLGPVLDEMLEMTSRYYVLGFQPRAAKGPATFHKVKVRLARKGVKLSHRPGYFERETGPGVPALQRTFDTAQLVVTGLGDNALEFEALCLPFPRPGERQALGVVLQADKQSLAWRSDRELSLEVYGYAVDASGRVLDHLAQFARIDPARADPDGARQGVSFFGRFEVPPGRYTIRLLVRDAASGASGVRFLEATVPPYDANAAFVLPPVVADEPGRWISLELAPGRAGEVRQPFPFLVDGQPFLPRASFRVEAGEPEKLVLIAYEPAVVGDPAADIEIRSSLTGQDGRVLPAGRLRVERVHREPAGVRTYVFSYVPEALEAGDYTLKIGVGESGALAQSFALLRVRAGS
jgi:VWFA-related protein